VSNKLKYILALCYAPTSQKENKRFTKIKAARLHSISGVDTAIQARIRISKDREKP